MAKQFASTAPSECNQNNLPPTRFTEQARYRAHTDIGPLQCTCGPWVGFVLPEIKRSAASHSGKMNAGRVSGRPFVEIGGGYIPE